MATSPIYAGGSRRGAAPSVTQTLPQTTVAGGDEVLMRLLQEMQSYSTAQQTSEAPRSSFVTGGDAMSTAGASSPSAAPNAGFNPGTIGQIGNVLGATGVLSRDRDLADFGKTVGQVGQVANAVQNPSVQTLAPLALSSLGVNPMVGGAVTGFIQDGVKGAATNVATSAVLSSLNPTVAAMNMIAQALGLPSISSAISNGIGNIATAFNYGTNIGSEQTGMLQDQDRGMGGWAAQTTNVGSTPADPTAMSYGTNVNSQQTDMLAAQDFGFDTPSSATGGSNDSGGGWGSGEGADGHGGMADSAMGGGWH